MAPVVMHLLDELHAAEARRTFALLSVGLHRTTFTFYRVC
jgi:hypothetical protein